jgi:diguanylate cyclase (GGDEF)-like protein
MEPFSLLFMDLDFFKKVNDTHGRAAGDKVLSDVAKLLQHETHSGELVARYGGEEFVILCPATNLDQGVRRAERLRVAIPRTEIGGLKDQQITVSFGVTQVEAGDSVESILRRADKALHLAKQSGRNRTCSVTNNDLDPANAANADGERPSDNPYVYQGTFYACTAADMIVYKLGGFVNDTRAKLLEVSPNRAVLRVGSRGLLPFWGDTDERRPVQIEIEFGQQAPGVKSAASRQVGVNVTIRPVGWVFNSETFQNRARRAMKHLRAFFVAG